MTPCGRCGEDVAGETDYPCIHCDAPMCRHCGYLYAHCGHPEVRARIDAAAGKLTEDVEPGRWADHGGNPRRIRMALRLHLLRRRVADARAEIAAIEEALKRPPSDSWTPELWDRPEVKSA